MNLIDFIYVLAMVESGYNPGAIGDNGKAVGILQIHPIVVRDVNRICGQNRYFRDDRKSIIKSIQMAVIYINHYERHGSWEAKARLWNGGPRWRDRRKATDKYWRKVSERIRNFNPINTTPLVRDCPNNKREKVK